MEEQVGAHQTDIGEYMLGKTLGKGTFGKVKLGTHRRTGLPVAIKILEKDRIVDTADVERVARQIHIMKLVRHPSIVQLYELIETPKYLMLVMEYAEEGELFTRIVRNKRLEEAEACRLYGQLTDAIYYCHRLKVVHRDIKPENLLLDFSGRLKLSDFGLSNTYPNEQHLKTSCGSLCYAAPEMLQQKIYSGLKVDVWSSGVVLYAMLCGCLPFEDDNPSQLTRKIKEGRYELESVLSNEAEDLLRRVLNVNPEERYDIEQIRKHPWMKKYAQPSNDGLMVGYNTIPIEEKVVKLLEELGYEADQVRTAVQANRHSSTTAAYYLLLKKFIKEGGTSNCQLSSLTFNANLHRPPPRSSRIESNIQMMKLLLQPATTTNRNRSQRIQAEGLKENVPASSNLERRSVRPKDRQQGRPTHKSIKIQEAPRCLSKELVTPANRQIKLMERQTVSSKPPNRNRSKSIKKRPRVVSTMEVIEENVRPKERHSCLHDWAAEENISNVTFNPTRGKAMVDQGTEMEMLPNFIPRHRRRSRKSEVGKHSSVSGAINLKRNVERYYAGPRG